MFEIKNLSVEVEKKQIIDNLNLTLEKGKIYALMGPNGSGKSTLANAIMGNPKYKITSGKIFLDGKNIVSLSPDKKAKKGLFLSFQYPLEIEGVKIYDFLKQAFNSLNNKKISAFKFKELINQKAKELGIKEEFIYRYLNQGFSGGEKKKSEILQLLVLNPKVAILDETDSGLDIDSLKTIATGIKKYMDKNKICLVITHYKRILDYLNPDKIFIMISGKIIAEGKSNLADELEKKGYNWINKN